jgi:hypothetical protein
VREKIREKGKAEAPKTLKMPVFSRVLDLKLDKSKIYHISGRFGFFYKSQHKFVK